MVIIPPNQPPLGSPVLVSFLRNGLIASSHKSAVTDDLTSLSTKSIVNHCVVKLLHSQQAFYILRYLLVKHKQDLSQTLSNYSNIIYYFYVLLMCTISDICIMLSKNVGKSQDHFDKVVQNVITARFM